MLWRHIAVRKQERVLVVKDGCFSDILMPGEHRILVTSYESIELEKHDLRDLMFESRWANYLVQHHPQISDRHFTLVATSETQVALVYVNGQLFTALLPAKRLVFWRDAAVVTAEVVDLVAEQDGQTEIARVGSGLWAQA